MLPEREDHREFVTIDHETKTITCSKCGAKLVFHDDWIERSKDYTLADHSLGIPIEVTQDDDPRLDVFKDFLDG
jgi:hypothetical protein